MNSTFNKKKINYFSNGKFIRILIILVLFTYPVLFIFNEFKKEERLSNFIQLFSEKFDYQFKNYELNSLNRVDKIEVSKIINKYLNQSIFLVPLKNISISLNNLKWVKNVNISKNLSNKIKVEIIEHEPVGLFFFNDQLFYFTKDGKVIDKYNKNLNEEFIIFFGKQALTKANDFLNILIKFNLEESIIIDEAYYVNERRWDVKLENEIIINLSEKNIEQSLKNYIKLYKTINKSEFLLIKKIDLRNNEKAIISFK